MKSTLCSSLSNTFIHLSSIQSFQYQSSIVPKRRFPEDKSSSSKQISKPVKSQSPKMASLTNLPTPPEHYHLLSNLTTLTNTITNSITNSTHTTLPPTPSTTDQATPSTTNTTLILPLISISIPLIFTTFLIAAYYISKHRRQSKSKSQSQTQSPLDPHTHTHTSSSIHTPTNTTNVPLYVRNMSLLRGVGGGRRRSLSTTITIGLEDIIGGRFSVEDGEWNSPPPPPPYTERWEDVDIDLEEGVLRRPPPAYHPLF
ncbi:hypothetical protein ONS96_012445 [Cadophora gregata f. sp. sojae]|nr:hypothetical protein ONS96_012445 [Cadophora gregata f. sp. sojae]